MPASRGHGGVRIFERSSHAFRSTMTFLLWCFVLYLQSSFIGCLSHHQGNIRDVKVMNVGEELEKETLPLNMGQRVYHIHGLKESRWYEVKISYPASIPASFSLQLKSDGPDLWLNKNRRLLNTEKIIFKFENSGYDETYLLVTVEAAGIVAKPGVHERENVLFNIVCDELSFGIPYKAWWVGMAAVLCLILAAIVPYFFPSHLLMNIQNLRSSYASMNKAS
ncbi:uncharacterized protein M6B38_413365 [Iris pallida]|uniref:Uncharacterized protein n=1 Tax=Iris pallida TaxID=29817 RepID=A0AAX6FMB7_IRIPA|nr:uncharacterized protein M6B38_413365 [Iris pallida]